MATIQDEVGVGVQDEVRKTLKVKKRKRRRRRRRRKKKRKEEMVVRVTIATTKPALTSTLTGDLNHPPPRKATATVPTLRSKVTTEPGGGPQIKGLGNP